MLAEKAGYDITTPNGASKLRNDIESRTGERLSLNTIKRITGVLSYDGSLRETTLEIIASYLGFESYMELRTVMENCSFNFDLPEGYFSAARITPGATIDLEWSPARVVTLRHRRDGEFEVVKSVNSKLMSGDTVYIDSIAEGLPLIIKCVVRHGRDLGPFTAALAGGLKK